MAKGRIILLNVHFKKVKCSFISSSIFLNSTYDGIFLPMSSSQYSVTLDLVFSILVGIRNLIKRYRIFLRILNKIRHDPDLNRDILAETGSLQPYQSCTSFFG